jgi:hypothetical protein
MTGLRVRPDLACTRAVRGADTRELAARAMVTGSEERRRGAGRGAKSAARAWRGARGAEGVAVARALQNSETRGECA